MQSKLSRLFPKKNKRKTSSRGTVFITSLVFLFVLIGTFRLCNVKTLHEAKLTAIFIQETQGFYLLENLMHLARDYAYQIVQNPREPHVFLSVNAYRTKDKNGPKDDVSHYSDKWVIDFNGSLSKQQIVPNDFSLQIADNDWDIKGGPIFWKDNKKNANDERYLAEVFMVGSLKLVSNLIPDWTIRTVQTMEIERNPLCDFALYAEGDTTINTNINRSYSMTINAPVQINGNARFSSSNGDSDNSVTFLKNFNCAGYALNLDGTSSLTNYILPKKYHMLDNCENNQTTSGSGTDTYSFNQYATNYGSTSMSALDTWHNTFEGSTAASDYDSYERYMFNTYWGNFNTRSRVYRPMGFDPSNYWGFWEPSQSQPTLGSGVEQNEQVLNFCFGFHNLAQSSSYYSHELYSRTGENNYSPQYAMNHLRNLNNWQMTEKAHLVEMQKTVNFAGLMIKVLTISQAGATPHPKDNPSLYVPNNFIYSTYISNAFPAIKDNIYLNRYFNLAFQSNSILQEPVLKFNVLNAIAYSYDTRDDPIATIARQHMYMGGGVYNNKVVFYNTKQQEQAHDIDTSKYPINSIVKIKSTFSPTGHDDDNCPPDRIVDKGTYWYLDNYVTRITGEHYNFMYDRNRAKWIQIVDIDVGILAQALNESTIWNGTSVQPIVFIQSNWQGKDASQANKNYRLDDGTDIRYTYSSNRSTFFSNYADGSYVYPDNISHPPVIDIGIRLVNAKTLPNKGLTICCPYPLYIQGGFNTTKLDRIADSGEIQVSVSGEISGRPSIMIHMGGDKPQDYFKDVSVSGTVSGTLSGTISIVNGIISGEVSGTVSGTVSGISDNGGISVSGQMSGTISKTLSGTVREMASLSIPVSVSGYISGELPNTFPAGSYVHIMRQTVSGTVSGTPELPTIKSIPPALIIADSITVLPAEWQDWRSQMDPFNSYLWYNGYGYEAHIKFLPPYIYADIITGRTHPHFWIQGADITDSENQQQNSPNPDMGIHDALRSPYHISKPIRIYGSLMLPYFCQEQWEPQIGFCQGTDTDRDPQVYCPPDFQIWPRESAGIPAGMPFYYRINRGRKTHYIGDTAYNALAGTTLYNKDWRLGIFTDYHDALPNYLKYEVDPE